MKSTGEVMGISNHFPIAFAKSQLAAGTVLPEKGKVFISVADRAKGHIAELAGMLEKMGYELIATRGTAVRLEEAGVKVQTIKKLQEGHPNVIDFMIDGDLKLVINTPIGKGARTDEGRIRAAAVSHGGSLHHNNSSRRRGSPCDARLKKRRNWRGSRAGSISTIWQSPYSKNLIDNQHFSLLLVYK